MSPFSPSCVQTYQTCPRQYEARYVTKEIKFEQNIHAVFGDQMHKAIEAYLKYKKPLSPILQPIQGLLDDMGKVFVGAETKLAVDKEGEPTDFFADNAYQRCIVDAIVANADKSVIICIDWKTGKKRDAQIQHDFIKKCMDAKYPNAKIITYFVYLFAGVSDRQEYNGEPLHELDYHMKEILAAHAKNSFPPRPSGLCKKWCDVVSCSHNGRKS